jgi:3-oxoacyl-[acyl-carrier protein] reductase
MMPQDDLDTVLSVNLTGTLYLTRQVIRRMLLSDQGGSIINISSIVGLRGYSGLSVYAATKAGLDAVTRSLARELGPRGIRVNSVAPGFLETEMTGGLSAAQIEQIKRRTPLGRIGHPADAVGPVLFLLSEASCFITGQVLVVDGGLTA